MSVRDELSRVGYRRGNRGRVKEEGQEGPRNSSTVDRKEGTGARNWAMGGRKLKVEKQNTVKRKRCTGDRM